MSTQTPKRPALGWDKRGYENDSAKRCPFTIGSENDRSVCMKTMCMAWETTTDTEYSDKKYQPDEDSETDNYEWFDAPKGHPQGKYYRKLSINEIWGICLRLENNGGAGRIRTYE